MLWVRAQQRGKHQALMRGEGADHMDRVLRSFDSRNPADTAALDRVRVKRGKNIAKAVVVSVPSAEALKRLNRSGPFSTEPDDIAERIPPAGAAGNANDSTPPRG